MVQAESFISSFGYLLGKLVRLDFFLFFLFSIFKHTDALAGYTLPEVALFFLTFNIIDILAQLFFRGIYGVRSLIREGDFDYFLIQPANVLFRVAFHTVDFLDVVTILPVFYITSYVLRQIPGGLSAGRLVEYGFLLLNGMVIAFAIHIAVAGLAVLTQELENTIWIYRDLMTLGRFPSDIYDAPMRGILTSLKQGATDMAAAIERGTLLDTAHALTQYWELKKAIDPGATNDLIEGIAARVNRYVDARSATKLVSVVSPY